MARRRSPLYTVGVIALALLLACAAFAETPPGVPSAVSHEYEWLDESPRGVPPVKAAKLRRVLDDLAAQHPGLLKRVKLYDGGDPAHGGTVIWGTAGKGLLLLNWRLFEQDDEILIGTAAHEFGHLVQPAALADPADSRRWNELYVSMLLLARPQSISSPILSWLSERRLSPAFAGTRFGSEDAGNQGECFAMAFAARYLWMDRLQALVRAEAKDERERAAMDELFRYVRVRPARRPL